MFIELHELLGGERIARPSWSRGNVASRGRARLTAERPTEYICSGDVSIAESSIAESSIAATSESTAVRTPPLQVVRRDAGAPRKEERIDP
jgi:hypothetical protein